MSKIKGHIHSFQSMGTLDGPGVRYVVFLQGCHLRCDCCHNPDTWNLNAGELYTPEEVLEKVLRYREYFKEEGGITLSGGEPLLQPQFVSRLFALCHEEGIHTCLDTSGSILNDAVKEVLVHTDRVLLDMKYTNDEDYRKHVGCVMSLPMAFLEYLQKMQIPVTLRQVIIPTKNDDAGNIRLLREIAHRHSCVDKIELLPFKNICQVKYDRMGIPFPFADLSTPTPEDMRELEKLLVL